jgi:hypothetical protein
MFWTFIAFAALATLAGWCIRSHADAGARDPGKRGKVTPDQVREIRALKGEMTQRALAERYGISDATVRGIQTGRWWKRVA